MITNWIGFKTRFPDEHDDLALLIVTRLAPDAPLIDNGARGALKGQLTEAGLNDDEQHFFLECIWGIDSTTKLTKPQGNILASWLRGGNQEKLRDIYSALKKYEEMLSSAGATKQESELAEAAREVDVAVGVPAPSEMDITQKLEKIWYESGGYDKLPEAPASVNFFASIGGYNGQFTLRDWSEANLLKRVFALIRGLEELGVSPVDRYGNHIVTDADVGKIAEKQGQPLPQPLVSTTPTDLAEGEQALRIVKIEVGTTKSGDPNLKLYAPNHQYPDLFWNFGIGAFLTQCPDMIGPHDESPLQFQETDLMPEMVDGKVSFPVYEGNWIAVWKESGKVSSKGTPYKDIVRVYPA